MSWYGSGTFTAVLSLSEDWTPRTASGGVSVAKHRREPVSNERARKLLARSGLKLTRKQLEQLAPEMKALAKNIARLDELDLGEVEPAISFSRRGDDR